MTIEQVLAEMLGDAAVLDRNGHREQAEALRGYAARVKAATVELHTELRERDAAAFCGRSPAWLRERFAGWVARGLARQIGPERWYRQCVLVHRPAPSVAREAGRLAARGAAA